MMKQELTINLDEISLPAELCIPMQAKGLVIFSHGSGNSRKSQRNKKVAEILQKNNFATLLLDLLTEEEDRVFNNRYNISLLTERLSGITSWARKYYLTKNLSVGYFGAGSGSAAALKASVVAGYNISAIVSRGGRPDLVPDILGLVKLPVLFIAGNLDVAVLSLNRKACFSLETIKDLKVVNGASHLFDEPGKLKEVAELAVEWFSKYLTPEAVLQ